jgi:uncharacterized protein YjiS (DUF1127 family)
MAGLESIQHWEEQREKIRELKEQGKKNKEIADILGIWERQVYVHLAKIKWIESISENSKKDILWEIKEDNYLLDIDKKNAKTELQILKKSIERY